MFTDSDDGFIIIHLQFKGLGSGFLNEINNTFIQQCIK